MEAPPVPPRISESKLWSAGVTRRNEFTMTTSSTTKNINSYCVNRYHNISQQMTMTRAVTPPPLPPRRWIDSSSPQALSREDINELLLVPPPPSRAASGGQPDLISFFGSPVSAPLTVPALPRSVVAPPNSPIWSSGIVCNETYVSGSSPALPRWDIPHSHSAPDLARLRPPDATHLVINAMNCMKKRPDGNLIDLCNGETANDALLKKGLKDDILLSFDPLSEMNRIDDAPSSLELEAEDATDAPLTTELDVNNDLVSDPLVASPFSQEGVPTRAFGELAVVDQPFTSSAEVNEFAGKLKALRRSYTFDDFSTNSGLVVSPTLENNREGPLSIQLTIDTALAERPVSFTCDVSTSIEHVISHVVCAVFDDTSKLAMDDFGLRVHGISEYFAGDTILNDYEYVHQCHKLDRPVRLRLVEMKDFRQDLARNAMDDYVDVAFHPSELLDEEHAVDSATVNILLETLHKEVDKLREQALRSDALLYPDGVRQAVKAVCATLCSLETTEINDSLENLNLALLKFARFKASFPMGDRYVRDEMVGLVDVALRKLLDCVEEVFRLYCQAFQVTFEISGSYSDSRSEVRDSTSILDPLLFQLSSLHQIPKHWLSTYESYTLKVELRHGIESIAVVHTQRTFQVSKIFFERIVFESWLQFDDFPMVSVPREACLYFFLYGVRSAVPEQGQTLTPLLGWTATKLFTRDHRLIQGNRLLGLWPDDVDPRSGPPCSNKNNRSCPLLRINLPEYEFGVLFPIVIPSETRAFQGTSFEMLDSATRERLTGILGSDMLSLLGEEEKELLWEKRHYLQENPYALPKLLLSVHGWDWACLPEIYSVLQEWKPLSPVESLVLLQPNFPDCEIRRTGIKWIKNIGSDELCDYLPQMVQVLKFEIWLDSPTVWFLLERSLTSIRVAHHLYWLLKHDLNDPLSGQRMRLVLNALNILMGSSLRKMIQSENVLLGSLSETAEKVKSSKESMRLNVLIQELETTHHILQENPTCLPLSPSLQVCEIDVKSCSYFTSNTLPLKVTFRSSVDRNHSIVAIYKAGDDLRQDMLTLQMIRIMDKLWLKEGLDLKIVTFGCFATAHKEGMVEMVTDSETLRKIQTEHGLTGSFKDRPIAEWLQKHNTSELEYQQAVENFTLSCAGYCVATYLLGIGDRHNDNIMLKTSGHIFHIDFGKFLGDSQMFGNIKRDRAPFVLTSDMVYVINGGDRPSKRFQEFIDICCQAFNILRKNSSVFLNLFGLMVASGIPGVNADAVHYLDKAMLPHLSEAEATSHFAKLIEDSLKSWFTQFNFFIHNLAQMRFNGDHNDGLLLSFIPKVFTLETDGKILSAEVVGSHKRYDPEKYYAYVVKVTRQNSLDPMYVLRSYNEFLELHQKLCLTFPLAKFRALPRGSILTRSNIREVADKRKTELSTYLQSLAIMAEEIAHCSLVYTFFHPLLRDQGLLDGPDAGKEESYDLCEATGQTQGSIKFSIHYKNKSLFIMVMHAKNLSGKNPVPDAYVKSYLLPDPNKVTKRKTKIVHRNSHPTFMEMLVYLLPYDVVRRKTLQVSVWNYDRVQENEFLGATLVSLSEIDLKKETTRWYKLDIRLRPS